MKDTCYLVFNRRGVSRMNKGMPGLEQGEFAVLLRMEVPDKVFERLIPSVTLTIPEGYAIEPPVTVSVSEPPAPLTLAGSPTTTNPTGVSE